MKNIGSLLNRGCGAYVSAEPFQLIRYLDEQAFRSNNRKAMTQIGLISLSLVFWESTSLTKNSQAKKHDRASLPVCLSPVNIFDKL
jgi:hypothetical protein